MPSRASLRQRLLRLRQEHDRLLEIAFDTTPLWRGLVHEARRRCGKPNCRCVRGDLHVSTILSDRSSAEQHNLALAPGELLRFTDMTEAYRKVRRHRARIVVVQRELLEIFDTLEAARREEGLKRHAHRLRSRS